MYKNRDDQKKIEADIISDALRELRNEYIGRKNNIATSEDKPVISRLWHKNGLLHREDGPAVEWVNGGKEYWYNGKYVNNVSSDEELKRYIKLLSIS